MKRQFGYRQSLRSAKVIWSEDDERIWFPMAMNPLSDPPSAGEGTPGLAGSVVARL